jgi:DNA polymerase III subunit beta
MQFTCDRDEILKALQAVSGVVATKGVHPVYESVEIVADPEAAALTLLGTDLEVGMRHRVGPSDALQVEEGGTAVVPAGRLVAICRELPKGPFHFAWNPENRECTIQAGRGRFRLQGQSPEDFPEIPEVEGAQEVTVGSRALREMVRRVAFAAAKERMRFALNGVLVKVEGERLELVATDGRRLARDEGPCENPGGVEISVIVPTKGLQHLDKALGDSDQALHLSVGNNHFCGRTDRVTVVSRLVEGGFPNYRDVIPRDCSRKAVLGRDTLAAALKRAVLVTSRDAHSVRLRFHDEGLTLSARSSEGSAEETVACDYSGEDEVVGFNPDFLLDALGVLTGEEVAFEWNGKSSPGKLAEGGYTYVVMPVSIE